MHSMIPTSIPLNSRLFHLVGEANAALAKFDASIVSIDNTWIYKKLLHVQESVASVNLSTKDDNIPHASVKNVFEFESMFTSYNDKVGEALAFNQALDIPQPLTSCGLEAVYSKLSSNPLPKAFIESLLQDVSSDEFNPLIQMAIIYAKIVLSNSFADKTIQMAHIMIPHYLCMKKIICTPMFFVTPYFVFHNDEYIRQLSSIQKKNDLTDWIEFFLTAIKCQSNINNYQLAKIYGKFLLITRSFSDKKNIKYLIKYCYESPIFSTSRLIRNSGIPKASALVLIKQLEEFGSITNFKKAHGRKPAYYVFNHLLEHSIF